MVQLVGSGNSGMPISNIDVEFYKHHGYLVLEGVVPQATIVRLRHFLEGHVEKSLKEAFAEIGEADLDIPSLVNRLGERGKLDHLSASTKRILSGHFPLDVRLSQELWEVPRGEMFRSMLQTLVDSDKLYMHMPPAARFVLPGNIHAGVPAHQDVVYAEHMSNFLTVWVPLVDVDDECGGIAVYPDSHHKSVRVDGDEGLFWFDALRTDGYRRVECPIGAGGAIVMNKLLIHESIGNRSDRYRLSIDYRYFGEGSTSTKHFLDLQAWHVVPPAGH
jgi:hypothetical protein